MSYDNYAKVIVQKYHIKLVGWPEDVTFQSPSKIGSLDACIKVNCSMDNLRRC
jgi:hypothetical protein